VRLVGFPLPDRSPLLGKSLSEIGKLYPSTNTLIVAIQRRGKIFIPGGGDTLQENDLIFCVMDRKKVEEALGLYGNSRSPSRGS